MKEKRKVQVFLLFLFLLMTALAFFSEGSGYGGGDSSMHMLMSKFSFRHPELFLNHWGKPFFILCTSVFAQFGFFGMSVFNSLCSLFTAYLVYLIAKELDFENAWLSIVFSLFAPVYFVVIFSGLTEVFFCFIFVLSIFLVIKKKYFLSALIVSFLPFIRSEGYLLLPLFVMVLAYRKQMKMIPFMLTGSIVYSLAGGMYYHDFLWTVHQNPYAGVKNMYGSGSLFFFIGKNEYIFGTALVVLMLMGVSSFWIRKKQNYFNRVRTEERVLLVGGFLIYFVAHSVFWWKGWFGSDGLIRVMAAVTPLLSLLALRGANAMLSFKDSKRIKMIVVILVIVMPFKQHRFPRHWDYEEATLHQAFTRIRENGLMEKKIVYSHPYAVYESGKDPFDSKSSADFFSLNPKEPESSVASGDLVIWDSHFGPAEGRIPLARLRENKNFRLLNSFQSLKDETPKDKGIFEVYVFQKF
ncbi:MAG: hypothetical protein NT126_02320 [Bacteroidetes bacterium]|nr:hypothetical protein [Bacteroidota bacterium]